MKTKTEYHIIARYYHKASKDWVADVRYTEKAARAALKRCVKSWPMSVWRWEIVKIDTTVIETWPPR